MNEPRISLVGADCEQSCRGWTIGNFADGSGVFVIKYEVPDPTFGPLDECSRLVKTDDRSKQRSDHQCDGNAMKTRKHNEH